MQLNSQAKTSMREMHTNLNAVKKLTSEEQLFYMANRIVVGRDSQSVNSANKFILGIMEGPARLLSVGQTKPSRAAFLFHSVKSQHDSVPNDIIPVNVEWFSASWKTRGTRPISIKAIGFCCWKSGEMLS
ncbi:hypothetical protein KEM48_000081 [Puccinia striiformis f. sp. tritici PST-130]|nr:hypothetical protein Pst134EB_001459 [Puccinia striiformis f. sp. tritici]KAI9599967.1 hypothetical protein KEM48_000081 [Puccinia striiformis f. sp. tritici PST-130]